MSLTATATIDSLCKSLDERGFAIVPALLDAPAIAFLLAQVERISDGLGVRRRSNATFAVRNLFANLPEARDIFQQPSIQSLLTRLMGGEPHAVRAILFDKNPAANWRVGWHQDTTIALRQRRETPGFGPWSVKAGVVHVQPPAEVLAAMLTVRLHLDDCDEENGALMVAPGSHLRGMVVESAVNEVVRDCGTETCCVPAGGALLMRPLLLHASSPSTRPSHRRVIHVEFASHPLPGGLEWAAA